MKLGLVLGGGGGKGAYELGVYKALKDMGVFKHVSAISGTSAGAINAMLFCQDDIKKADEIWNEVTIDMLVPLKKSVLFSRGLGIVIGKKDINLAKKIILKHHQKGGAPKDNAAKVIDKYVDFEKIRRSKIACYVTAAKLPTFEAKYFKINNFPNEIARDMVLASASLPLVFDSTKVLGECYIDGGIVDNVPIKPVYEEGCNVILAVSLNEDDSVIDKRLYPNSIILEIFPKKLHENVFSGILNLDCDSKRRRIKEGYYDTICAFKPLVELIDGIHKRKSRRQYIRGIIRKGEGKKR